MKCQALVHHSGLFGVSASPFHFMEFLGGDGKKKQRKGNIRCNWMRLSAVSSSAIWDNFMIYNPVQFILCNNPGGFHLACSDTMLGKEKPNIFAIFPALCLCLTPWSNNGYSPAPRPCSFQSHPCSCQGWLQSLLCQSCPEPGAICGHPCPSWAAAHGSGGFGEAGAAVALWAGTSRAPLWQQSQENPFIHAWRRDFLFYLWLFIRILWILALQSIGQIWAAVIAHGGC